MEMNIKDDHVHLIFSVPPRLSVSEVMGMLKGKTAIKIFKSFPILKEKALLREPLLEQRILCEYHRFG